MKKQESIMQPQHRYCSKLNVKNLNEHLMCVLCGGYFVDATTIIECLHSFCRTCIVQYLESSKYCPICDVQVHKTRPLLNIRADKTLQDLVYKLIPGLFDEEMRRRREFLKAHPEVKTNRMDLEQRGQALMVPVHSLPDQHISLVLEMATFLFHGVLKDTKRSTERSKKAADHRYLLCPPEVTVRILKKFLRCKFNVPEKFQVDLFYVNTEETISDDFTLLDLTFIYNWNRDRPFRLYYMIYEQPRRKRRLLTDRLFERQQSQTKKARIETADQDESGSSRQLCISSVETPSSSAAVAKGKTPAVGNPLSKPKQKTQITKEFWKSHSREKLKIKKKVLENMKKAGRDAKNMKTKGMPTKSGHSDSSRPKANGKSVAHHLLTGKAVSSSSPECDSDRVLDVKTTLNGNGPSSPSVQKTFQDKDCCSAVVTANGVHRPSHSDNRSASPRLSSANSSRSASPRQSATAGKTSKSASPRPTVKRSPKGSSTKDNAKLTNGKEVGKVMGGRDTSRPCSRGSSRTESPRPAEVQQTLQTAVFPSLPVGEKISVDVSMTASETSSDVTSPGAEDRANSTGLEEAGDFDRSAGHMCNVTTFVSQPLPTLVHVPSNEHKPTTDKGNARKHSPEKRNGHKQSLIQENGFKQSPSKNNGQRPGMDKMNGNGHSLKMNKGPSLKNSVSKACQVKERSKSPKTSSLIAAKSNSKTTSNKKITNK